MMADLLDLTVADFLSYIGSEKGLARNTREAYGRDVGLFVGLLREKGIGDLSQVTEEVIIAFLALLKGKNYASSSIYRTLIAVKVFFRFLRKENLVASDPTAHLESPKVWQLIPEVLSSREVEKLLEQPETDDAQGARDKAILEVLYASGLRVSEVCGLDICDVDDAFVRVLGKGGKERLVPIARPAVEAIDHYLMHFRSQLGEKSEEAL